MGQRTKHVHRYLYTQLSPFNRGWKCDSDYCTHFLPRNVEDTIIGRMSICHGCSEHFKIDEDAKEYALRHPMGWPLCIECRMTPEEKKQREVALEFMKQMHMDEDPLMRALRLARERSNQSSSQSSSQPDQIEVIDPTSDDESRS